ncbi:MAG: hypothetical protein JNG88_01570 [Phycisphaerales bacterium]|nr:hypothetical protein [Phycisphaerales bacterium]
MLDVPYEKLIAYAAGELSEAERATIEQALTENPAARATLARFAAMRDAALSDNSPPVPAATLAAAKQQYAEHLARVARNRPSWLDAAKQIIGKLIFDSRSTPALAGVRGAQQAFHVAFESPIAQIDLQITRADESESSRWMIVGQIDLAGPQMLAGVALAPAGTRNAAVAAQLDAGKMFRLSAPAGTYDLLVSVGDAVVVFENLELG